MNSKKVLLLCVLLLILSAMPVLAAEVNTDGPTYWGNRLMAVNTKIGSNEEELRIFESTGIFSRTPAENALEAAAESLPPLCGTPALSRSEVAYSDVLKTQEANAGENKQYQIGDKKELWNINPDTGEVEKVWCVCAGIGEHCTIWKKQGTEMPDADIVRNIQAFDSNYDTLTGAFGSPDAVDVDGDHRIALLYIDMGWYYGGFFQRTDLLTPEESPFGVQMDMLHVNSNREALSEHHTLLAELHEFQHLINYAMVGENVDAWLDEVFSKNAEKLSNIGLKSTDVYQSINESVIKKYHYTSPFVFGGDYVYYDTSNPFTYAEYTQWFYFGRYLSRQTQGYPGGGDQIFSSVLKTGSCTRESLIQVLTDMGYLGKDGVKDWNDLIRNYNLALYYQEDTGLYGFGGEDIFFTGKALFDEIPWADSIPGGGSATFGAVSGGSATPASYGEDIIYAGMDGSAPVPSVTPTAALPSAEAATVTRSDNAKTGLSDSGTGFAGIAAALAAAAVITGVYLRRRRQP